MLRYCVCFGLALCLLAGAAMAAAEAPNLVPGDFETWQAVKADAQGLYSNWKLGEPAEVPLGWTLNGHYAGGLQRGAGGEGQGSHVVLRRTGPGHAHLYVMLRTLKPGTWYRFSARLRGGSLGIHAYQYNAGAFVNTASIGRGKAPEGEWNRVVGYYRTPAENWTESALALALEEGQAVAVDDVELRETAVTVPPGSAQDITLKTPQATLVLAPSAVLRKFALVPSNVSLGQVSPAGILTITDGDGSLLSAISATLQGDKLTFGFPDGTSRVTLQVQSRPYHWQFTVSDFAPADLRQIHFELPVRQQEKVGAAFGATYGRAAGLAVMAVNPLATQSCRGAGADTLSLGIVATRKRGLRGASWAVTAAAGKDFKAAIIATEKGTGLPCPVIGGKWLRDSDSVRKSYLFAAPVSADEIDTLIQYAKIGGFETIIFLKDSWLKTHGHFEINEKAFPGGLKGVRAAVDKIHRAGLEAGVHVFGPSISPNDPYVTPVPDPRLATVPAPPLAEAVDEKSTTLTLTGAPNLPPKTWDYQGFPGYYLRLGDEIISYQPSLAQEGPPFRYTQVQRGALGTKASPHPAGTEVKGLLAMWGFFLVDPDSTLADELTTNFARVFNACDFDFAYFDASDGSGEPYMDTSYYLNKLHLAFYRKFKRSVMYQTSIGTGSGPLWHIVPRSASADGHGDIKGYLDDRWPGILGMGNNWTKADVGWYYWFKDVRPDQIEYVCSKVLGLDGSLSLETSRAALESLPQSRQMMEMIGRWERARRANFFPASVRNKLLEPKKDFKIFSEGKGWQLYRAMYEDPRSVDVLDGTQNTWIIHNDRPEPVLLGVEIVRSTRQVAVKDYTAPGNRPWDLADQASAYQHGPDNRYERYVIGGDKLVDSNGVTRRGVTHRYEIGATAGREGQPALVYEAENKGAEGGWCAIGRRYATPLDLSGFRGLGFWLHGDGKGQVLRLQLRDSAGRNADWTPRVDFTGWRLHTFSFPTETAFDWKKVEYLLVYFNNLPSGEKVRLVLDDLRLMPALNTSMVPGVPALKVNGTAVNLGTALEVGETITHEGVGRAMLWPRGMAPGKALSGAGFPLRLQPGANKVELTWGPTEAFPGGVDVMLYRLWPLEGTR